MIYFYRLGPTLLNSEVYKILLTGFVKIKRALEVSISQSFRANVDMPQHAQKQIFSFSIFPFKNENDPSTLS